MQLLPEVLETLFRLTEERMRTDVDVSVKLGPLRADLDTLDAIGVGVDGTGEDQEPASAQTLHGLAWRSEAFDITCVAQSLNGDDDLAAACRRAYALFAEVEAVVPELADLAEVWEARIVSHAYRPLRTDQGAMAVVEFVVHVDTQSS